MPRLMSVSLTEDAVRARTKTVTRRKGWTFLKPGDRLTLCRKVMGRRRCSECGGDGWLVGSGMDCCGDVTADGECRAYCVVQVQEQEQCPACGGGGIEPLERIAEVEVTEVRREPLWGMSYLDVGREGFPDWTKAQFVQFFIDHMGGDPLQEVTRIEWRYL